MFGGTYTKPPLPILKPRPVPKIVDVCGNLPYSCGHFASEPNTSYKLQLAHYHRIKAAQHKEMVEKARKELNNERQEIEFMEHFNNKTYRSVLNRKIDEKMEEGKAGLEERRNSLRKLLWKEEREYLKEIVEVAQKSKQIKLEEKLEHIKKFEMQKEIEREALVTEKRVQQNLARCAEFRPLIVKQRNLEAKKVNLLQMKEKEAEKEKERELEYFWQKMNEKYCEAKDEKEEQEQIKKVRQINEIKFYAEIQTKEKNAKEEKRKQELIEEQNQLDKLRKDIEEQERLELEIKRKKHKETCELFETQLKERKMCLQRTADEESSIQKTYDKLADEELAKEQAELKAKISTAHEDIIKFKEYLTSFRKEREKEIQKMKKITDDTMKKMQKKYDDDKCKEETKRQNLLKDVLEARAKQLEYQKRQKDELQKAIKEENEISRTMQEQNRKLRLEFHQQHILNTKKYRQALDQQIIYKKTLKEREQERDKQIIEASKIENKKYNQIVADFLSGDVKVSETHLFRKIIDGEKCPCLKPNY